MSKSDVRMVVYVEPEYHNDQWGDDLFYVVARPRKMKFEDGEQMPYGSFYTFEGDLPLDDFQVRCSGHMRDGVIQGCYVEYGNQVRVELHSAEQMVKVLRKVTRGQDKLNREFGYLRADDPAGYIARVARILGITHFGVRPADGSSEFRNGYKFQWWDAAMLETLISERIKQLRIRQGVEVSA